MTEDQFWSLIEQARCAEPASADPARLAQVLRELSDNDVIAFGVAYECQLAKLNDWRVWGAGYVIGGGMSDDGFQYFRSWIIGKGKRVFDLALTSPDALGPEIDDVHVNNEGLEYVFLHVLDERSISDPRLRPTWPIATITEGQPFDESNVHAAYPKLSALFG